MSRFSLLASAAVATLLLASIPASAESMSEKTLPRCNAVPMRLTRRETTRAGVS